MDIISNINKYIKKHRKLLRDLMLSFIFILLGASMIIISYYRSVDIEREENEHSIAISNAALTNQNNKLKEEVTKLETIIYEQNMEIEQLTKELETSKLENNKLLEKAAASVSYPDRYYIQSTYVWRYLKDTIGLSDYVAAGILGNIMVEVGGQTLDISMYSCGESSDGVYYGICQWSKHRRERLLKDFGSSLEAQCKFLSVELFEEIPKSTGFYELTDEKEVALYFAKNYERCNSRSYKLRQNCATYALEYFTGVSK